MRVSIIHGSAGMYGADRVVAEDIEHLVGAGALVSLVVPFAGPLTVQATAAGARVVLCPSLRILRRRGAMRSLVPALVAPGCETADLVVLSTLATLPYAPALVARRIPFIVACHEVLEGGAAALIRSVLVTARSAQFLANSNATRVYLESSGVPGERIDVLYPSARHVPTLPRAARDSDQPLRLGIFSRLQWGKGHLVALDALLGLPSGVDVSVIVAGGSFYADDPDVSRILGHAAFQSGRATYVGELEDPFRTMADCDGVLVPSTFPEPFSLVPLEAGVLGMRTIGSRIGGLPESTLLAGGVLVDPGDPEAWSDAIQYADAHRAWFRAPHPAGAFRAVASGGNRRSWWDNHLDRLTARRGVVR